MRSYVKALEARTSVLDVQVDWSVIRADRIRVHSGPADGTPGGRRGGRQLPLRPSRSQAG